ARAAATRASPPARFRSRFATVTVASVPPSAPPGESVSLHAPAQQIEAVLPEKRLVVKDHQRDAPMPGAFLRDLIFGDRSFITIRIALDFRIEPREPQPCALRGAGEMAAEMPVPDAAENNRADCCEERQSLADSGGGGAQPCQPVDVRLPAG